MKKFTLLMAALLLITSSLNAANSKTEVAQVSSSVSLTTDVDYVITGETPFATAGSVDIQNTEHAVLIIQKIKPSKVIANWMGNIFIKGRKKNMLLGPNGQNIYPEEIEDKLNSMLMVSESIIVQRNNRLEALIHPDYEEAQQLNLTEENVSNIMQLNQIDLNEQLPAYEQIMAVRIQKEEFQKTPKRSIKRYLYK